MTFVESGDGTSPFHRSSCDDDVIEADHLSRNFQRSPDASVLKRGRFGVGENSNQTKDPATVGLALSFKCARRTFHTVPQLGHRDRGNLKLYTRLRGQPASEVEGRSFALNDDIRIKDYRHRFTGGFRIVLARRKSFRQAFAFSGDSSNSPTASANSRPVHVLSPSGTRRATGKPFLSRTYVTFW
jgi:hypothetical protein